MPCLIELYAAENDLTSFEELKNLPQLKKLHLRKNKIVDLIEIPNLPLLYHLNLRENLIAKLSDFSSLLTLGALKSITAHQNPVADEIGDAMKKEVVMIL